MKKILSLILLLLISVTLLGREDNSSDSIKNSTKTIKVKLKDRNLDLYDLQTIQTEDWSELFRIPQHPAFDSLLTKEKEEEILEQVNQRRRAYGKDTLLTADLFYIWAPYLNWLNYEDPHCRVIPDVIFEGSERQFFKNLKQPAFDFLRINDTIIIDESLDPLFKRGDMLVSVNDVPISEYLKYAYNDRYGGLYVLLHNYYFSLAVDSFKINLIRGNKPLEITTSGQPLNKVLLNLGGKDVCNTMVFENEKCGYIEINQFYYNNKLLIKKVHSAISDFKKNSCTNVILDLRKNPGGNGHAFDKLLSIFINKEVVHYQKGQKIKVSEEVINDFDFLTEDMIGQLVEVPKGSYVASFPTDPKMYIDGISYYVLMSKNTNSVASSFANILQYNNAAKLVGEPLLHNAIKYGDILDGKRVLARLYLAAISTTEVDEYTKSVDGFLMPDIHIPYIAKDYLAGKDAMLEKLLMIIRSE